MLGKMKAKLYMYKDLIKGYFKYKEKIRESDLWIYQFAHIKGMKVNPHKLYLTKLKIWIAENEEIYGQRICPCFEATGDKTTDTKLLCPCTFAVHDIEKYGTCHCNLFGQKDLTDAEWKLQEERINEEFRFPLKKVDAATIDTRNAQTDKTRDMNVPVPVHQLKHALHHMNGSFNMIVEKEQSAKNMVGYGLLKNVRASYQKDNDNYIVTVEK